MKIIVLGDIHGRQSWALPALTEKYDRLIFIGDYFDSFDFSGEEQIGNFKEICQFKEKHPEKIVLLIGNHDYHYFPEIGYCGTSGYQAGFAPTTGHLLSTYRDLLQMAHSEDNLLFTHAGVGEVWLKTNIEEFALRDYPYILDNAADIAEIVNDLWRVKPNVFRFTSNRFGDFYGDSDTQTPIWIRPEALMRNSKEMMENGIVQIVGHTRQNQIHMEGKYYFIDTLGSSGEYLIIEDKIFKTSKI